MSSRTRRNVTLPGTSTFASRPRVNDIDGVEDVGIDGRGDLAGDVDTDLRERLRTTR
jgi:hypothetical protein